jgi:Rrf2 family nitric oxide-sensitive transcriptional repressor
VHLTDFSDYGLRVLIYLCVHEGPASLTQLADAYGISRNHLVKVVSRLAKGGFVATRRGPGGGIELGAPPDRINIGEVVKYTEPHFNLVECFDASHSTCKLTPACALRSVLAEAHANFIATLSRYSLADIAKKRRSLAKVFR